MNSVESLDPGSPMAVTTAEGSYPHPPPQTLPCSPKGQQAADAHQFVGCQEGESGNGDLRYPV